MNFLNYKINAIYLVYNINRLHFYEAAHYQIPFS